MSDQIRVLGPPNRTPTPRPHDVAEGSRPPTLPLLGAVLTVVIIAVALWAAPPASTDLGIEPSAAPPEVFAGITTVAEDPAPIDAEGAIATVRYLNESINLGDPARVLSVLAEQAPRRSGFRRAEWPILPTDAGWWEAGLVTPGAVEGSVRYIFTVPGSVFLKECEVDVSLPAMGGVTVTCDYSTSSGPLAVLGQSRETGHVHVMLVDGLVVGTERHGTMDQALWSDFARWSKDNDPEAFADTLGPANGRFELDPTYTGNSALIHVELAATKAELDARSTA